MKETYNFTDWFWETDFNGTLGFDIVCKRIKDGQKTCRDIEDFFKKKAKAEQLYSKALKGIARSVDGREENGIFGKSWQELKIQTDRIARYHDDSAVEYNKLADDITKFADGVKVQHKMLEDRVKDTQKLKRTNHSKMSDLQRAYHEKCREMINMESQVDVANQSVTISVKEVEKLKVRFDKSREAMEKADVLYGQWVDYLENSRRDWEHEMTTACTDFERMDNEKIVLLRDCLWKCTNIESLLSVNCDDCSESVRQHLEKCDVEEDINEFVTQNRTGNTRPVPIKYENYFEDNTRSDGRPVSPNTRRRRPPCQPLPPVPDSNQQPEPNKSVFRRKSPLSPRRGEPQPKWELPQSPNQLSPSVRHSMSPTAGRRELPDRKTRSPVRRPIQNQPLPLRPDIHEYSSVYSYAAQPDEDERYASV